MITKYSYGSVLPIGAVDVPELIERVAVGEDTPYFVREGASFKYQMKPDDIVYGLGENVRGINKRGWLYQSLCSDDPHHHEDTHALYGAHNFFVIAGKDTCFGVFVDYPGVMKLDIGYTKSDLFVITPDDWNLDFYVIENNTCYDIVDIITQFRRLIGSSYIPPKWAFGFGQSRWSYPTADDVREVVRNYRAAGIPLDSVYLDIDYMERYKDFTVDETTFPNFKAFVQEMKEQHIHLIPIIDAGVKIEDGYEIYEEGVKEGYFCKEEDGTDFVAGVWPGRVHFPDVLNEKARKWFGHQYKVLLDMGIEGFWNDMNEPAIFYSEKKLQEAFEQIEQYKNENLGVDAFFAFQALVAGLSNNVEDYKGFYHEVSLPDGSVKRMRHDQVHNLYGFNMTRAAAEAFEELCPDKRILLFSRSSYIGMHRYGGIWTGDNLSWWSHLLLNIKMMPSLNMCGFLYTGADIGGFGADATEDLVLRWTEFGIFTPLMRNHAAKGTRYQEAYQFSDIQSFADIIQLRYGLLPYIYSEFVKAALGDGMYFKPLAFDYWEDEQARRVEDQLLVGESIMIAPVYEQNAKGRYVYLPESMKLLRMKSLQDRKEEIIEAGHHYLDVALNEVLIFIRPGHVLPLSKGGMYVDAIDETELEMIGYAPENQ